MKKYKIKKIENMSLSKQLVSVTLVALLVCIFIIFVILPKILKPFYEDYIFKYLRQPSKFIEPGTNKMSEDIAFIIITNGGAVYTSNNLTYMIQGANYEEILEFADKEQGKFEINGDTFYYLWGETKGHKNLIITDRSQINEQENSLLRIILPTIITTIAITVIFLFTWSQYVLKKIKKIDKKTKALITGEQISGIEFIIDDELNDLSGTIDEVNEKLKQKDEYKNLMFQNLSHELKTPISVIQSYIEAVEDEVVDKDEAIKIISDETKTLYSQVNTILQINKIDFMKDSEKYKNSKTDIKPLIEETVQRYKPLRNEITFLVDIKGNENTVFNGTDEMWRVVLDNLYGNFIRYAKTKIKIKIENNKIILINDGEKIDKEMLDKMFLPYVKGQKGQSGLGLSIVKKTVNLFGYDINAKNIDTGVEFVIC